MKVATLLVCIGVAGLLGYGWYRSEMRRAVETARARASRDSLVAAVVAERDLRAARYTRDSLQAARKIAQQDSELRRARLRADSSAEDLGNLLAALPAVLQDSLQALARRINASWTAHLDADLAERAGADSALTARNARIADLEQASAADRAACDQQVDKAMRQLDAALRRSTPGLATRIVRAVPVVLGAIGAWEAVKAVTRH